MLLFTVQDEAKQQYIDLVTKLKSDESQSTASVSTVGDHSYQELLVSIDSGVFSITLNRPSKKNAINYKVNIRSLAH